MGIVPSPTSLDRAYWKPVAGIAALRHDLEHLPFPHAAADTLPICSSSGVKCHVRGIYSENLAPRHGFEPRFTAPKAAVLPLDDRGKREGRTYSKHPDC